MPPDAETIAEQVFTALADPTRRAILAALARDWDSPLGALAGHLDQSAHGPAPAPPHQTRGHHG
jgi:DNA-binding transcriptional ArsR family regulator